MGFWYLKLHFRAGERPGETLAYICLRDRGYGMVENHVAITTQTVGLGELEAQIDQLQSELEKIRSQARLKFGDAKQKWAAGENSN
jgi:hypothetical protein